MCLALYKSKNRYYQAIVQEVDREGAELVVNFCKMPDEPNHKLLVSDTWPLHLQRTVWKLEKNMGSKTNHSDEGEVSSEHEDERESVQSRHWTPEKRRSPERRRSPKRQHASQDRYYDRRDRYREELRSVKPSPKKRNQMKSPPPAHHKQESSARARSTSARRSPIRAPTSSMNSSMSSITRTITVKNDCVQASQPARNLQAPSEQQHETPQQPQNSKRSPPRKQQILHMKTEPGLEPAAKDISPRPVLKETSTAAADDNDMTPPIPPLPTFFDLEAASGDSLNSEALTNMLVSWFMSGYYTGYYRGLASDNSKP